MIRVGREGPARQRAGYNFDCAVPRTRDKGVFGDWIPTDGKRLALVFVKVHDGEFVDAEVIELERAIAARDNELILVDFGPGEIVKRVVCVKAASDVVLAEPMRCCANGARQHGGRGERPKHIRLFYLDALRRERERIEAPVADDAKVGGRGDGDARVVVGRVLDRVGVEPWGAKLEHGGHAGRRAGIEGDRKRRRPGGGSAGVSGAVDGTRRGVCKGVCVLAKSLLRVYELRYRGTI